MVDGRSTDFWLTSGHLVGIYDIVTRTLMDCLKTEHSIGSAVPTVVLSTTSKASKYTKRYFRFIKTSNISFLLSSSRILEEQQTL